LSSSLLGVYTSFFIDSAPAPTIILIKTLMFVAVFLRKLSLNKSRSA